MVGEWAIPRMTLAEYWQRVTKESSERERWRYGQTAFNVLAEVRPDLAEGCRGSDHDPFYAQTPSDPPFRGFIAYLDEYWGK